MTQRTVRLALEVRNVKRIVGYSNKMAAKGAKMAPGISARSARPMGASASRKTYERTLKRSMAKNRAVLLALAKY